MSYRVNAKPPAPELPRPLTLDDELELAAFEASCASKGRRAAAMMRAFRWVSIALLLAAGVATLSALPKTDHPVYIIWMGR